jgi:hypothetical protein
MSGKPRLHHLGRIDTLLLEMSEALVEEAADSSEDLQIVGSRCVVERKGHGLTPACDFPAAREFPQILIDCNNCPNLSQRDETWN